MIEELTVKNFALIDSLSLSFQGAFNVLTGETGAGKSIIVGALSFLLGGKADIDVIRTGSEEASVSALVSVDPGNTEAAGWLTSRDIETEDGRLIIRRNIKSSGRNSIFIQSTPVTRADLAEFMSFLFDLHGQHSHESLLKKETHRRYLDRFASLDEEVRDFGRVFTGLAEKKRILEASLSSEKERENRIEILKFAAEEIGKAAVKPGEIAELETEARRLGDFEKLAGFVNSGAAVLFDEEVSVLTLARKARNALDNASAIDEGLQGIQKRTEALYYEAEDIAAEFRSYRDGLRYDPKRLEEVEERLALLFRLKKKYAAGISSASLSAEEAILAYREDALFEIEELSSAAENRDKLKAEISVLEKDIVSRAAALSSKRSAAAVSLSEGITAILKRLGMPNARFSAAVQKRRREGDSGGLVYGPWGADEVEFLISANAGEPLKDLSRIASGGELSRVMLAVKTVLAASDNLETLVFDEIDTGIGGEVALAVGEYMAKIGEIKQIFCVTHLASIAVRADNHLKVEKKTEGGRTFTGVSELGKEERRVEIARMLAGDAGEAALAHADDLILKYGGFPKTSVFGKATFKNAISQG
ncbi:MAG: DNA repair protein RecN [Treponema sp.]|jgi:DNA repair protein RecN (Recombination protein N)|nr:DNA repair protein RecN [Treponema sp.]